MTSELISGFVTVLTAIIGVAIIAVIVSKNAQTPQVLQAGGRSFAEALGAAVSPVTGGSLGFTGGSSLGALQNY
jgi:hypothetical protein